MGFSLLINGVEYNCNLWRDTLEIHESFQANGSTMRGTIQLSGALAAPQSGNHVQFYKDSVLEFAGRIQRVSQPQVTTVNEYVIECTDYTVDFDSGLINAALDADSAGNQLRRLVSLVGRGFTANNVADGPLVGLQEVEYEIPSSIASRIAESVEHNWYIDYERDVHMFYILDRLAPVTSIDFDTNVVDYSDFDFDDDSSQVKNVIFLSGAQVKSETKHSIIAAADGDTRFWPLGYEPWSVQDTTVTVDGIPQTILLDGVDSQAGDGGDISGVVYLCIDNWGIRFPDENAPVEDAVIGVSYSYVYNPVIVVEHEASIAFMRARENQPGAPSSGRHELKFNVPDLRVDNEETIVDYGNLLLLRYAYPAATISFNSWTQGWKVGQNFRGVSARRNFDSRVYITGVTKRILKSSGGEALFKYELSASNVPFAT